MTVTLGNLFDAIYGSGSLDRPVCFHGSLSSFGHVQGGASTIVDAFLAAGSTLLVPTFSRHTFGISAPLDMRPSRNGISYGALVCQDSGKIFSPKARDIDADMGAIPSELLLRLEHVRGNHPLCSFSALGLRAATLIGEQTPLAAFAPLEALAQADGLVILAGVGLSRMTLLHHAEHLAGRVPFLRWARLGGGEVAMVTVGGCSEGFEQLSPILATVETRLLIGSSLWRVFPAREVIDLSVAAIRNEPMITCCPDIACIRCADAIAGGPRREPHESSQAP